MSLINDALKRAKQAQQQRPPSTTPGAPLRPVERRQSAARRDTSSFVWVLWVLLFVGLVGFVVWRSLGTKNSSQPTIGVVDKPSRTPVTPAIKPAPIPAVLPPTSVQAEVQPAPQKTVAIVTPVAAPAVTSNPVADTQPIAAPATPTNAPIAAAPPAPPPQPVLPKLQGIFYRPDRPAALINGRTVLAGDSVGEFKVVRIDQRSATLVGGGQTIVLKLSY